MSSLKSISLRDGHTLVFQRDQKGNVRAVVKDSLGCIVHRGPVVPEDKSESSKISVLCEFTPGDEEAEDDEYNDWNNEGADE